jgi:hypothetical protein
MLVIQMKAQYQELFRIESFVLRVLCILLNLWYLGDLIIPVGCHVIEN